MGRRMGETAALWVEHLLPPVAYRQFVLSFDGSMAHRLGYDVELLGRVCRSLARRVSQSLRRRVKREHRLDTVATLHPGIVTVIQRFRSDLGLYVHLHRLVTDGAFEASNDDEAPQFRELSAPSDSDLVDVLRQLADDLGGSTDDDVDIDPGSPRASNWHCRHRPRAHRPLSQRPR